MDIQIKKVQAKSLPGQIKRLSKLQELHVHAQDLGFGGVLKHHGVYTLVDKEGKVQISKGSLNELSRALSDYMIEKAVAPDAPITVEKIVETQGE